MISASSATMMTTGMNIISSVGVWNAGIECSLDSNIPILAEGEHLLFLHDVRIEQESGVVGMAHVVLSPFRMNLSIHVDKQQWDFIGPNPGAETGSGRDSHRNSTVWNLTVLNGSVTLNSSDCRPWTGSGEGYYGSSIVRNTTILNGNGDTDISKDMRIGLGFWQ
jgi:hypothetical protein